MPIYQYKCKKCKVIEEVFQKTSNEPLTVCPLCRGELVKIISPVGIVFKGAGFHITDYSRKSSGGTKEEKKEVKKTENSKSAQRAEVNKGENKGKEKKE